MTHVPVRVQCKRTRMEREGLCDPHGKHKSTKNATQQVCCYPSPAPHVNPFERSAPLHTM